MNNPSLDAGIPLLTEVIPNHPPAPEKALLPSSTLDNAPAAGPEVAEVAEAAVSAASAADWDDEKWDRMERELRERVLYQVLERIDFVLEQRVRDSLADVLQTAVEGLASEIRGGLQQTVKEVITRAVSQEIAKLQTTRK